MNIQSATFGGGCFWGVENYFQGIPGVIDAVSGYAGGSTANPDYNSVCRGNTGHAEVVDIEFNAEVISYAELVDIFLKKYGATGNDNKLYPKSQYRSIILYRNSEQEQVIIDHYKKKEETGGKKFTTEVVPLDIFYKAEDYHQDYYGKCRVEN